MTNSEINDWHIDLDDPVGRSVVFPGQLRVTPETAEYAKNIAERIYEEQAKHPGRDRFVIHANGIRYRIQYMHSKKYAARSIGETKTLEELKVNSAIRNLLLSEDYSRGGLILICGPMGSGKTSTAVATVLGRLSSLGGFCMTVEDPPEYQISGFHGEKGYCEQLDVTDCGFAKGLAVSLRCFPSKTNSMLFFGEVRDKTAAAELLRIAIDGRLVIATTHAKDIEGGLQRILTLAGSDGEDEARYLLSSSIKIVIHQTLDQGRLLQKALICDDTVSAIIKNNREMNLVDSIRRTNNMLTMELASRK